MRTKSLTKSTSLENLQHLASFAAFILDNKLDAFVKKQLGYSKELDIPLLKSLSHLDEKQLLTLSKDGARELLDLLSRNRANEYISRSVEKWIGNQLPLIDRNIVTAEDISLVIYIRKKSFLSFVPEYTSNTDQIIELIDEIDLFSMKTELTLTNVYIDLLKTSINEHAYLIEKVNETLPGALYVQDLLSNKIIYTNHKLHNIIGLTEEEWKAVKNNPHQLLHPDDAFKIEAYNKELSNVKDGEIITYRYRIRSGDGQYIWLRNYESVFKRNEEGSVSQKIGITLNVDKEQKIAAELIHSDERYKQAEAITHIGNFVWDPATGKVKWSDELYRIFELEPDNHELEIDFLSQFTHPDDKRSTKKELVKAIEEQKPFDYYYRIITARGNTKILHIRGSHIIDRDGKTVAIIGTSQDVTEKQNLIADLREKESVYKQAEELANMGNWKWDVASNNLEWTDQLYRIYGLVPQSEKMTIDRFLKFVHPDNLEEVKEVISSIYKEDRLEYTFRIVSKEGQIKILRTVAQVKRNENGEPVVVIGSERDITEKQNLIDQLRRSENLYKQAQLLTHMGNWTWDMINNKIYWSDELFKIYGLEPQSQEISFDFYLSMVHPDDRQMVLDQVKYTMESGQSWEFSHRILLPNAQIRIIYASGEILKDEKGKPYMMLGTAQDVTERQMMINKLQESEALYKQAQSLAHIGNWTWDMLTNRFTWSDEMYRIYELEMNESIDLEKWLSFRDPEDRQATMQYLGECIEQEKLYDRVEKIILRNGKVKMIHRKGEILTNEKGEPVKMIGTTQDITSEYRVQHELKENQTFIRKIADATPSIIASYNINTGNFVFISEGIKKLLGYEPEEVFDKGYSFFQNIIHPDDLKELNEKNSKALEEANAHPDNNDIIEEFTYRLRHKNGEYKWFHTYGTIFDRNSEDKVEHILNISLDVTEQVEASTKIKEQEYFIKQIADASPTILYLYDVETQSIVYVNREIFFVLGYMPEEIIEAGDSVTELIYHPDDYHLLPGRKQSGKTFQQVDSMIQYECRMKNKETEWKWVLVREIVFNTGPDGKIKQVLGAALDINRRKEMEKTILQNTLLLEQSNASLEEFAYVASHDLKEPLRKISTFGDRLVASQTENLSPEGKIYLNKIVDASQRMQTMINDLLSISMITGNTAFEKYSLNKILEEITLTLEYKIEQQNAVIKADELPEANIIPSQFRQLFQNLISNSLKFIRPDVQPVITIRHSYQSPQETIHFQLAQADQYHKIEISDNGIGFENEFAGKIFAIFQRLHGRSEYEGSGIGLAICKKIVEHHGGVIYASGEPGVGATFTIILPATAN